MEIPRVFSIDINNINYLQEEITQLKNYCDITPIFDHDFKSDKRHITVKMLYDLSVNKLRNPIFFANYEKHRNEEQRYTFLKENALIPKDYSLKEIFTINDYWKEYYLPNLKIWHSYDFIKNPSIQGFASLKILQKMLNIPFYIPKITGIFYYPPNNGYREWHTNYLDTNGYRCYIIYKKGNCKSGTNFMIDKDTMETFYDLDDISVNIFKLTPNEPRLWHSIFSKNDRFSTGFALTNSEAELLYKKYLLFCNKKIDYVKNI